MSLQQLQPIGIFDSGIGGLTVFQEIAKLLPFEDLVYLGDTARVPYGTKSAETVTRYAVQAVDFLISHQVKVVVVACNTASAFALSELEKRYSLPVIGVIEPGVTGALRKGVRLGVIGTEGTIRSEAYVRSLRAKRPEALVVSCACPLFVPLVEEGWLEGEVTEKTVQFYLEKLLAQKIETLILGCTHYPLLKKTLQKVVGPDVRLIDSAEETARAVATLLKQKNILRSENKSPSRKFFVTDSPERFRRVGEFFLRHPLQDVQHVTLGI